MRNKTKQICELTQIQWYDAHDKDPGFSVLEDVHHEGPNCDFLALDAKVNSLELIGMSLNIDDFTQQLKMGRGGTI